MSAVRRNSAKWLKALSAKDLIQHYTTYMVSKSFALNRLYSAIRQPRFQFFVPVVIARIE